MTLSREEITAMSTPGEVWEIPDNFWVPPNYKVGPGVPRGARLPSGMARMIHRVYPIPGATYMYIVLDWSDKDTHTQDLLTISKLVYKIPMSVYKVMLESCLASFSQAWLKSQGVERVRHDESKPPGSRGYWGDSEITIYGETYTASQLIAMGAPEDPNGFDDYIWRLTAEAAGVSGVTSREKFFEAIRAGKFREV